MMHFTDITGLAGIALMIAALAARLPVVRGLPAKQKIGLVVALLVVAAIPFGGLSVLEFVRGVSGDLSVTTLVLLALALQGKVPDSNRQKYSLLALLTLAALLLYPAALGLGMFDTYRLGFGNLWFIAALLLLALGAWLRQFTLIALSISLAVLAWSAGWYESNNLWDYLLDPWVAIYAVAALLRRGAEQCSKNLLSRPLNK